VHRRFRGVGSWFEAVVVTAVNDIVIIDGGCAGNVGRNVVDDGDDGEVVEVIWGSVCIETEVVVALGESGVLIGSV
jgi:hypothetical protein